MKLKIIIFLLFIFFNKVKCENIVSETHTDSIITNNAGSTRQKFIILGLGSGAQFQLFEQLTEKVKYSYFGYNWNMNIEFLLDSSQKWGLLFDYISLNNTRKVPGFMTFSTSIKYYFKDFNKYFYPSVKLGIIPLDIIFPFPVGIIAGIDFNIPLNNYLLTNIGCQYIDYGDKEVVINGIIYKFEMRIKVL